MFRIESTTQRFPVGKDINVSDRANQQRGRHPEPGPFSWYSSQPALPEATYVLTSSEYVVLP